MDNLILGLLFLSDRTIYQLRERIAKGLSLMYSDSMGSIQAAVKKLLGCGLIRYEEAVENGKYKKIYFITELGKQQFLSWVNTPMSIQKSKSPELSKLYFMGFSEEEGRAEMLEEYLSRLREQYGALEAVCKEGEALSPEELGNIGFYQLAAARYGRDFMRFNIEWYQRLLEEEKRR